METPFTSAQTYMDEFDPVAYHRMYYHPEERTLPGERLDFALRNYHGIFTSGKQMTALLTSVHTMNRISHMIQCSAI